MARERSEPMQEQPIVAQWFAEPMQGLPEAVNPYIAKTVLIEDLLFDGQGLKVRENDKADYKISSATGMGNLLGIYPIPGGCPFPFLNGMLPSSWTIGTKGVLYQPHRSTGYFFINRNQWLHVVSFQQVKSYNAGTQKLVTTGYVQYLKHMERGTLYFAYYDNGTYRVAKASYQDGKITEIGEFEASLQGSIIGDTGILSLNFATHTVCVFRVEPILVAPQPVINNATSNPIETQVVGDPDFMQSYQWTTTPQRQALVIPAPTARHYSALEGVATTPLNSHYIGVGCIDGDGSTLSGNAVPNYWMFRFAGGDVVANHRLLANPIGARESALPSSNTEFSKASATTKRLQQSETDAGFPKTVSNSWDVYREDGYYWDVERNLERHFLGKNMAVDDRSNRKTDHLNNSTFTFPLRERNMTPAPYRFMTYKDSTHLEFRFSTYMPAYNEWCYYVCRFLKDPLASARDATNYQSVSLDGIKRIVFPFIAAYGIPEQDRSFIRIGFLRNIPAISDGLRAYPSCQVNVSQLVVEPPAYAIPFESVEWSAQIEAGRESWNIRKVPIRFTNTIMDFYEWQGTDVGVDVPSGLTDIIGFVIAVYVRGTHGANQFVYGHGTHTMRGNAGSPWADEPVWSVSVGWGRSSDRRTYWAFQNDHVWNHLVLRFPKNEHNEGSRTKPTIEGFDTSVRYGWGYVRATGRIPRGPKTYVAALFYGNTPGIASTPYTYTSYDGQPVQVSITVPDLEDVGVPVKLVLYRAVEGGWKAVADLDLTSYTGATYQLMDIDEDKGRPFLNVSERLPYGHSLSLYDRMIISDGSLVYGSNVGDWISFTRYPAVQEDGFLLALPEDIRALSIRGGSILGIGQHRHYRLLLDQALTAAYLPLEPETIYAFPDMVGRTVTDTAFLTEDTLWVGNRPAFLLGRQWRIGLISAWVQPTPLGVYLVLEYSDRIEVYEPAIVQEGYVRGVLKKADLGRTGHHLKSVSWTGELNLIWNQADSTGYWATLYRKGTGNKTQGIWKSGYTYIPTNHYLAFIEFLGEWNNTNPLEWHLIDPHGRAAITQPDANILEGLTPKLDGKPVEAVGVKATVKENQRFYGAVAQLERGGLW